MGGQNLRDKNVMLLFGQKVRDERKNQQLTQEELARMVGTSASQIARIESGRLNTTISTVIFIAKAMQVSPTVFFDFDMSEIILDNI